MIVRQRIVTTTQDIPFDELTNVGRYNGEYLDENFTHIEPSDVFNIYLQGGLRIPDDFVEVRQILEEKFAVLKG